MSCEFALLVVVWALACAPAARADGVHVVDGVWVWDRSLHVPPPGIGALTQMTPARAAEGR
jgi:hypothetical protein